MSATPSPRRFAVAGNPVAHSQSPAIHAAFARQTGLAVVYERLLCPLDGFARTVRAFADAGGSGCNITLPFKFEAHGLAARHTPRAELALACNTLRFEPDGWVGDNTDGPGLARDLEINAGVVLRGTRLLLVGAGGGAAGALGSLLACGPAELVVANRTVARAEQLVERHARAAAATTVLRAASLADCGAAFDVVVNASASSVAGLPVPVSARVLRPGTLAVDMMYGAQARPFLAWAASAGAVGRDGLGMLVEQAAAAFEFWNGVRPQTAAVLAELRATLSGP
ncbi:MAG TPA: shikimate dehydrogenase [Caldimonas sp.]|nr:shikimate dehydrogenase [Caldimonas sp.]HEX2540871.1 shikimate dehydrogenase [Caldimonas sp.]